MDFRVSSFYIHMSPKNLLKFHKISVVTALFILKIYYSLTLNFHFSQTSIKTTATKSIRSKIMNLREENPKVSVDALLRAIGWEYLRTPALNLRDGGMELANQQNGFQMINPSDKWFPGKSNSFML